MPKHAQCCHTKHLSHWIVNPSSSSHEHMQRIMPVSSSVAASSSGGDAASSSGGAATFSGERGGTIRASVLGPGGGPRGAPPSVRKPNGTGGFPRLVKTSFINSNGISEPSA